MIKFASNMFAHFQQIHYFEFTERFHCLSKQFIYENSFPEMRGI